MRKPERPLPKHSLVLGLEGRRGARLLNMSICVLLYFLIIHVSFSQKRKRRKRKKNSKNILSWMKETFLKMWVTPTDVTNTLRWRRKKPTVIGIKGNNFKCILRGASSKTIWKFLDCSLSESKESFKKTKHVKKSSPGQTLHFVSVWVPVTVDLSIKMDQMYRSVLTSFLGWEVRFVECSVLLLSRKP